MEEITGFSMKDCLSLPGLGLKYFNSLRTEEDEPIYTYNDQNMRWFVRQAAYGGRVCAFNQYYKSKSCDDISKIISEEVGFKGDVHDIMEVYMNYKNKHLKIFEKEYEKQFNYYRDKNVEEKQKYINEKLSEFPIHQLIRRLKINELLWDFDCVSLYPSAMWDKNSLYSKTETVYDYTKDTDDKLVEKFNNQTFTQGSAILKINYYNPKNLIGQHLPIKEKEKRIENNRMRNGYIVQTLTSVDTQEILKIEVRVIKIYQGVIYREIFKINTFEKVIDNLFASRQNYKNEHNEVVQLLVKLIMNGLYGKFLRKDVTETYQCKSEAWMMSEYDERVLDYHKTNYGN